MVKSEPIIYVIGGIIAATIIAMSVFFILKSVKRAKKIGMDMSKIKKAISSSAIFSIVPSIPIVVGIGIMMTGLGLAIPWIRLTVIGALQYELIAYDQANKALLGTGTSQEVIVATAVTVMTLSILSGPLFNAIGYKKYQTKLADLQKKNKKLMDTSSPRRIAGRYAELDNGYRYFLHKQTVYRRVDEHYHIWRNHVDYPCRKPSHNGYMRSSD